MDDETIQPTRIDKREYELFKEFVRDVHGKTRGHLSSEIENALREYRKSTTETDPISRIEDDIATIKAQLATEADGGVAVAPSDLQPSTHAHAENTDSGTEISSKPSSNAPRADKVEYLISKKYDRGGGSLLVDTIIDDVKAEFHFEDRTAEKFIQPVVNELDAKRHPNNSKIIVWGAEIERVKETSEGDDE